MKRLLPLTLSLSLLVACGPTPSLPGPSATPSASPSPGPASSASQAQPQVSASPATQPTVPPSGQPFQPQNPATVNPAPSVSLPPVPAKLKGIQLTPASLQLLAGKGSTLQLQIQGLDASGKPLTAPLPLSFSLNNPDVFSIDAQGLVTALAASGSSVVIVTVPGTSFETRIFLSIGTSSSGGGGGGGGGGGENPGGTNPVNLAPVVSITPSETTVTSTGKLVRLTGAATDPEGQALSYLWTCLDTDCGDFSPTTSALSFWRSPNQSGTYRLQLSVTDTLSATTTLVQEIVVNTGTSQVQVGL